MEQAHIEALQAKAKEDNQTIRKLRADKQMIFESAEKHIKTLEENNRALNKVIDNAFNSAEAILRDFLAPFPERLAGALEILNSKKPIKLG